MGRPAIEMIRVSKGKVVRAFDWWGFGWVCIALALGAEMQRSVYTPVSFGGPRQTR